jgi:amino acid transporter
MQLLQIGARRRDMSDVVAYKREVLVQFLLVATILGAFSMSGLVALLTGARRDRLHSFLYATLALASLAFVFATALDAILLPVMRRRSSELEPEVAAGLLRLGDAVIWGVIVGTLALVGGLAVSGFVFSGRMGVLMLAAVALTIALFLWHAWELARLATLGDAAGPNLSP